MVRYASFVETKLVIVILLRSLLMNTRILIAGLFSAVACMASLPSLAESATWTNPELYGHVVFDPPQATTDATIEAGEGDLYGSVLLDAPAKATADAVVERGENAMYDSIFLDDYFTAGVFDSLAGGDFGKS
jgi:hypothetical protein